MTWKRHGSRKVIVAPDGGDAWPDDTLIRALARAHRWKGLLEERRDPSAGELAEAESVTRSFVNRLLRLTLLVPDIVEAILEGRPPKGYGAGGVDIFRRMSAIGYSCSLAKAATYGNNRLRKKGSILTLWRDSIPRV